MKRFAVISDIHGNLEALNKALKLIQKDGVSDIICLGDAIGYGANPNECFRLIQTECRILLMGNHEAMLVDENQKRSNLCEESFSWTKAVIADDVKEQLLDLPYSYEEYGIRFYHASSDNSLNYWPYLKELESILDSFRECGRACFYGHTHRPRVTIVDDHVSDLYITETSDFTIDLSKQSCYINPGSIGQQRDTVTDMSFAICEIDDDILKVKIVRHRYNALKAYLKTKYKGCGKNNADYLIREKWRRKIYESIGHWCKWIYR